MAMEINHDQVDGERKEEERAEAGSRKGNYRTLGIIESSKPYVWCVLSNLCYAAFNIISKVCLDKGMSRYVLVAYGHAFATLTTALLALLVERRNESKLNLPVWRDIFFLGLLGALLRTLYYAGMEYTSSTFACAMANLTPALTFLLAILFRMEKLNIKKHSSQAKIAGTVVSFVGATLMTLYKGITLFSLQNPHTRQIHSESKVLVLDERWIKGSLMLFIHCLSSAAFYILQATTIQQYPAPMVLTSLSNLVGTVISTIATVIIDHEGSAWRLSWNITLVAPLYSGIVIFGITVYLQILAMRTKGPVFVTAFRPLATVMVAIMGVFFIGEALQLGSVVGAVLIIVALYAILWGKEDEKRNKLPMHVTRSDQSIDQTKPEK